MTRTFFSKAKAELFAEAMKKSGGEFVKIWGNKDGFGQTQYSVEWYIFNEEDDDEEA